MGTTEAGIRDLGIGSSLPAVDADAQAARRRRRWLVFWFYVGVPLALGFLLGWLQVGRAEDWPRPVSLVYWVGVSLMMTAFNALATAALAPLLRRLRSPLWLTLFLGQIVAGFVFSEPVLRAYRWLLQATLHPEMVLTGGTMLVGEFLQRVPSNSLLWVGINLLFFYGLRMPRFGYEPAAAPAGPPGPAATAPPGEAAVTGPRPARRIPLLERVRPERRGALLAVQSEGHYLRVHTDAGSDLILYRLSDAMLELAEAEDGAQVHRSWWVAARAVSAQRHRDKLVLSNGVEVPVSRSFRVAVRRRGWLASVDSRDEP